MISLLPTRAVALQIGSIQVHWYGIMYFLAFVLALVLLPYLQRYRKLTLDRDEWASIVSWGVVGVLVGGRLGFVLFYEPYYYAQHPFEILAVWKGGMSSHGGFVGVILSLFTAAQLKHINVRRLADVAVIPAAIGLAMGRIGNFINQELYGTPTNLPWGINIEGVMGVRHPLQIYDALLCLGIALACYLHLRITKTERAGTTFALFLILYGIMRFFLEFIREQQYPLLHFGAITLTVGQLLTLPLLMMGLLLLIWFYTMEKEEQIS